MSLGPAYLLAKKLLPKVVFRKRLVTYKKRLTKKGGGNTSKLFALSLPLWLTFTAAMLPRALRQLRA
jgi:hypothetical protein